MKSNQERLIRTISEHSMGAPYVFQTKEYKKGSSTREPADLVWVCNGCIILMYMKQGRNVSKAIKGNLDQAAGWLRAWQGGQPLIGHNENGHINLSFNPSRHLVIVSVVRGDERAYRYHYDEVRRLFKYGVVLCATIPEDALIYLTHCGGGAVDIVNLMILLAEQGASSVDSIMEIVHRYHERSAMSADPGNRWVNGDEYGILKSMKLVFLSMRSAEAARRSVDDNNGVTWMFNDMTMTDYFALVTCLANMIWSVKFERSGPLIADVPLEHYRAVLGVWRTKAGEEVSSLVDAVKNIMGSGDSVPPNTFGLMLDLFLPPSPWLLSGEVSGPSLIETILNDWKSVAVSQ
ncbi:hypothetical protein [Sorangium sp. So ce1000]|uniref:hypothetical protein n=1 Tax=Sorangium sp. So ce1000 TaxID=3133325 RepID=UPI003F5EDDFA